MRIVKLIGGKALAVALGLAMVPASIAVPQSAPVVGSLIGVSQAEAQYYRGGHRGYYRGGGRHWRGDRGYRGHRHYRGHRRGSDTGALIGGAIAGLAAGAIIAGATRPRYVERRYIERAPAYYGGGYGRPAPWTNEWYRYCSSRYRSFDARSGTFQPYNGPRQLCR